jgi:hypothetical protein
MITQIYKIKEIENEIDENTLIAFDLDNTLLAPHTYYGSVEWEEELLNKYIHEGFSSDEALNKANELWYIAQEKINLKLIESESHELINKWKSTSNVIGITARDSQVKDITFNQLKLNQISFSNFDKSIDNLHLGTLYCAGRSKSKILSNFIENVLSKHPKKILIIDDKKYNLDDILSSSLRDNFEIKCFHYLNKPTFLNQI